MLVCQWPDIAGWGSELSRQECRLGSWGSNWLALSGKSRRLRDTASRQLCKLDKDSCTAQQHFSGWLGWLVQVSEGQVLL